MDQDSSSLTLALGHSPPSSFRIVARSRDILIVDLPSIDTDPVTVTRSAIILDKDADMRVLDVLFSLHARNRAIRANVVGLAETGGRLMCWYGDPATLEHARRVVQDATTAALWPRDQWRADQFVLTPMRDGIVDRDQLEARDLLRCVPSHIQLGLVQVHA